MWKSCLQLFLLLAFGAIIAHEKALFAAASHGPAGTGLWGQYYNDEAFTNFVGGQVDATVNLNLAAGTAPGMPAGMNSVLYSISWTGQVYAPVTGTYTFQTI